MAKKKLSDDVIKWTLEVNGSPAQKALNDLNQETRKLETTNKSLRVAQAKLEAQGKKNTQEYRDNAAALSANSKKINENKSKMGELRKEIGVTGLTMRQLKSEARKLQNQLDNAIADSKEWHK